jgi:uncharacterized protein GlcG (DUF336 family)
MAPALTRPGLALIAGGLPVVIDGTVAAGLGVAGAMTGEEDRRIAERAVFGAIAALPGGLRDGCSSGHESGREPTS